MLSERRNKRSIQYVSNYIVQNQAKLDYIFKDVYISGKIMKKSQEMIIINIRIMVTFSGEGESVIEKGHTVNLVSCWQCS